jgi:hypothetical protein
VKQGDTQLAYFFGRLEGETGLGQDAHKIVRMVHTGEHWIVQACLASCCSFEAALAAARLMGEPHVSGVSDVSEDTRTPLRGIFFGGRL